MAQWISLATGVMGLCGIAGACIAYLSSNRAKATIELYRGELDIALKKIDRLEEDEETCKHRLAVVEGENRVMRDLISGIPSNLSDRIERRFDELEALITGRSMRGDT